MCMAFGRVPIWAPRVRMGWQCGMRRWGMKWVAETQARNALRSPLYFSRGAELQRRLRLCSMFLLRPCARAKQNASFGLFGSTATYHDCHFRTVTARVFAAGSSPAGASHSAVFGGCGLPLVAGRRTAGVPSSLLRRVRSSQIQAFSGW